MKNCRAAALIFALVSSVSAHAATVTPISYDMRNGDSGNFSYWDDSYSGHGNTNRDNARLRLGLGDLTDGVIAAGNWIEVEGPNGGPYVGWSNRTHRIVFRFSEVHTFASATFHFDSSGGSGGAAAPIMVAINGQNERVNTPGPDPFAFTFDMSQQSSTDRLNVSISRDRAHQWTFLSEVSFEAQVVETPLPASGILLFGTLVGFGVYASRKNKKPV